MRKFDRFLFHFYLHISMSVNYFLVHANPLIGETVTQALAVEFPSVVSFGTVPAKHESDHYCTGTLITEKHVLTCAHCVKSIDSSERWWKKRSNIVVTVGSTDVTQGTKHEVAGWMTYDKWFSEIYVPELIESVPQLYHDIAIVKLVKAVENVKPARLSQLKYDDIDGKTVVAAGWGHVSVTNDEPRYLQRANLEVIDEKICEQSLNEFDLSHDIPNHFCTVGKDHAISLGCGDSGGPIFTNGNEIIGISDAVCNHYGHPKHLNLHLRLEIYRTFIEAVIGTSSNQI